MIPMEEPLSQSERPPPDSSSAGSGVGSFECNICLDLARDPVVTLCGHLFCWPCLYQWLHGRVAATAARECPVCKAAVEEEKVVPLYGRGNSSPADPREKKSVPSVSEEEVQIPHRPMGQRPETARPAHNNYFHQGFGNFMGGGGAPANSARFGNVTFSAGFGFFPSLFGLQLHDYPNGGAGLGIGTAYPFGMHMGWPHGYRTIRPPPPPSVGRRQEAILSKLLLLLGILVILLIIFF